MSTILELDFHNIALRVAFCVVGEHKHSTHNTPPQYPELEVECVEFYFSKKKEWIELPSEEAIIFLFGRQFLYDLDSFVRMECWEHANNF